MVESDFERARRRALRLLASQPRSVAELRSRLERAKASAADTRAVIEEMTRLGYLNDRAYAEARVRSLRVGGKNGPRGAIAKLRAKGIDLEDAKRAVQLALAETSEDELAVAALAGRPYGRGADEKANARAARLLLRRGFSGKTVSRLVGLRDDFDISED